MLGVVVAVVAALLVIGAVVTYRMARSNDTVESFRRQIDALSPEARRGTVDQVNRIDDTPTHDTPTHDNSTHDDSTHDDTANDIAVDDTTTHDAPTLDTATDNAAVDDIVAEQPDAPETDTTDPPDEDEHGS